MGNGQDEIVQRYTVPRQGTGCLQVVRVGCLLAQYFHLRRVGTGVLLFVFVVVVFVVVIGRCC